MAGLLKQIHDNQAIALLYLSGELDSHEQQAVSQQLANDAELRQCIEQMRQLQAGTLEGLAELDARQANPVAEMAAVRRIARAMTRHQAELAARPVPAARSKGRRIIPAWVYPLAGAAAVAFIMVVLSEVGVFDFASDENKPVAGTMALVQADVVVAHMERSFSAEPPTPLDDADEHLKQLNGQEADLSAMIL